MASQLGSLSRSNGGKGHKHAAEWLNPRSLRYTHSSVDSMMQGASGFVKLDDVIEQAIANRCLPDWPALLAVRHDSGDGLALHVVEGNRRLYVARAVWRRGAIASVKVEVLHQNDARIAKKLNAFSSASFGHTVKVRHHGQAPIGAIPVGSKYVHQQSLERERQENLRLFLESIERRVTTDVLSCLQKHDYMSVDALHKLTKEIVRFGVPLNFYNDLKLALQRPSPCETLLEAEGQWIEEHESEARWAICGTALFGPDCSYTIVAESVDNLPKLVLKEQSCYCYLMTHNGLNETVQLLKWCGDAGTPALFTGTWRKVAGAIAQPPGAQEACTSCESKVAVANIAELRGNSGNASDQADSCPQIAETTQWLEDTTSPLKLAVVQFPGHHPMFIVYADSEKEELIQHGNSILAVAAELEMDSGDGISRGCAAADAVSQELTSRGDVWASANWQLRRYQEFRAVGVQGKKSGRDRTSKVALAITLQLVGGSGDNVHWPAGSDSLMKRATDLLERLQGKAKGNATNSIMGSPWSKRRRV